MELGREVESRSLGTHREQAAQKLYKCLISRLIMVLSVYPSGLRYHVSTQGTWTSQCGMGASGTVSRSFVFGVLWHTETFVWLAKCIYR